jgi:hypothetical protein
MGKRAKKASHSNYNYQKLIKLLKKFGKSTVKITSQTYHTIIKKVSGILHKLQPNHQRYKKNKKKNKKIHHKQHGGNALGTVITGVEDVTQGIADALMKMCPYNSGGTGGDIGTLAEDLVGVVLKIGCAAGNGLNTIDSLLELPANLGTAYREPGAPGANLS